MPGVKRVDELRTIEAPAPPATMLIRVPRLFRAEITRLRGRAGPPFALLATACASLLASLGVVFVMPAQDPTQVVNGWRALAAGASWGLAAAAFMSVLLSSQSIAAEAASGSLRTTLTRQALRSDLFAAKAVFALAFAAVLHAAAWLPAIAVAAATSGFGDVTESIPYAGEIYVHVHRSGGDMSAAAWSAFALSFAPLAASSFLGLACSAVARRPASALSAAVVAYLSLEFGAGKLWPALAPFSFTTYATRFTSGLEGMASGLNTAALSAADGRASVAASLAASIILLSGSFIYFRLRDFID